MTHKLIKNQRSADFMPNNTYDIHILKQRADAIAKHTIADKTDDTHMIPYVRFRIGSSAQYGIPYVYTKEVLHQTTSIRMPNTPNYITGVLNRRGALIATIDLNEFLFKNKINYEHPYIIIVHYQTITIGIWASHIENSSIYDPKQLDRALQTADITNEAYVLGLHKNIISILNIDAMISDLNKKREK